MDVSLRTNLIEVAPPQWGDWRGFKGVEVERKS
jgi:hypothetical protein